MISLCLKIAHCFEINPGEDLRGGVLGLTDPKEGCIPPPPPIPKIFQGGSTPERMVFANHKDIFDYKNHFLQTFFSNGKNFISLPLCYQMLEKVKMPKHNNLVSREVSEVFV